MTLLFCFLSVNKKFCEDFVGINVVQKVVCAS